MPQQAGAGAPGSDLLALADKIEAAIQNLSHSGQGAACPEILSGLSAIMGRAPEGATAAGLSAPAASETLVAIAALLDKMGAKDLVYTSSGSAATAALVSRCRLALEEGAVTWTHCLQRMNRTLLSVHMTRNALRVEIFIMARGMSFDFLECFRWFLVFTVCAHANRALHCRRFAHHVCFTIRSLFHVLCIYSIHLVYLLHSTHTHLSFTLPS